MTPREQLVGLMGELLELALHRSASTPKREVVRPVAAIGPPPPVWHSSARAERTGAWMDVYEAAAERGAVMQTKAPAVLPHGMADYVIKPKEHDV